ncbi:chromatin assembly factor 1 protein WD40 domain, putative [Babesia caballi]|uniref:Chromatin assembly factor 1 protein WD40 domain, putative n=1 Tax=Babesia caballi TaxID=5871 RepID=A0AAV4M1L9_BABCB|nr:chromatin assembly factor 1 protein WD40 domain, putative [Babesia caballi]
MKAVLTFSDHEKEGYGLAFHKTEPTLGSCSEDGLVNVWDLAVGSLTYNFLYPEVLNAIEFLDHENRALVAAEDGRVLILDMNQSEAAGMTAKVEGAINAVSNHCLNPDIFATGSTTGAVHVWDYRNLDKPLHEIKAHKAPIVRLQFNHSCPNLLASAAEDSSVRIFDLEGQGSDFEDEEMGWGNGNQEDDDQEDDDARELIFTHTGHREQVHDFCWSTEQATETGGKGGDFGLLVAHGFRLVLQQLHGAPALAVGDRALQLHGEHRVLGGGREEHRGLGLLVGGGDHEAVAPVLRRQHAAVVEDDVADGVGWVARGPQHPDALQRVVLPVDAGVARVVGDGNVHVHGPAVVRELDHGVDRLDEGVRALASLHEGAHAAVLGLHGDADGPARGALNVDVGVAITVVAAQLHEDVAHNQDTGRSAALVLQNGDAGAVDQDLGVGELVQGLARLVGGLAVGLGRRQANHVAIYGGLTQHVGRNAVGVAAVGEEAVNVRNDAGHDFRLGYGDRRQLLHRHAAPLVDGVVEVGASHQDDIVQPEELVRDSHHHKGVT